MYVGAKFYDLSKSFDTVNHQILLAKEKTIGFYQIAVSLIKSYLDNRVQCVF